MLRKRATDAERILWRHLRNRNFVGHKFRRQHPLGCYVLDFYCLAACRPGHDCVAVLEPSSSVRTRQRLESNLVCVGEKAFVATLTSILSLPKGKADFVRRRRNKRGGTSKCEKTAQAVTSKSQTPNPKNPGSDHGSFRHCIFIDVSALSALCVVHPVLDFDD